MPADRDDIDEQFRQIVAGWEPEPPEDEQPRRDSEQRPEPEPREEEHYVPPPAPPVPRPDPVTALALAGALGGPVLLLAATLVQIVLPRFVVGVLVTGFVAGIITLIWRLGRRPRDPYDPDDGAVV